MNENQRRVNLNLPFKNDELSRAHQRITDLSLIVGMLYALAGSQRMNMLPTQVNTLDSISKRIDELFYKGDK